MATVTLTHDCDSERRGDGSAPADQGGDFRDCYIKSGTASGNVYDATQFNAGKEEGGKGGAFLVRALLWFDLNYFMDAEDPQSIREWAIRLNLKPTIPGGNLHELVPDQEKLKKILHYHELKPEGGTIK